MSKGFSHNNLFPNSDEKYDLSCFNFIGDEIIPFIFTIFISVVGMVGNGTVIWLLVFRVKRKPFASYFLNLAVADFGCLMIGCGLNILNILQRLNGHFNIYFIAHKILVTPFMFMCSSSQLFLTAIGIDRCVSVIFPNWYQCHQSPVMFVRVCGLIWALSFLLGGIPLNVIFIFDADILYLLGNAVSTLVCILLVTISALTLLIKVCFKLPRCHCGNLLKVVLLMHLTFLLFSIPTYTFVYLIHFPFVSLSYCTLGTSLTNSINPLIYFLAGKPKGGKFLERMKVILQTVFKEERDTRMEVQPHIEIQS